jgi:predicted kinase
VERLVRGPAVERLEWILDGLDGVPGWGADAAEVLAPEFTTAVPAHRIVEVTRRRSAAYAPVAVVGVEVAGHTARARIRNRDGTVDVVTCTVEPRPPHRITATWVAGLVPADLTPRLPMDFTDHGIRAEGARLVVFSGLPGTGKSTLADAVGRRLGIPVFATDWLLGALTPFGGRHLDRLLDVGAELLTTLAVRQLSLGQSAILDHPAEDLATRARWRSLARRAGAEFAAVVCVCSDPDAHRTRVEGRRRGIPGWHDASDWADITRRLATFPPWPADALTIDSARPHEANVAAVLDRLGRPAPSTPDSRPAGC